MLLVNASLYAQVTKISDKVIGGNLSEDGKLILATSDGGYILGGNSESNTSGDKSEDSRGSNDYWVVKYNASGVKQWDKRFGGPDYDNLTALIATPDGGYLLGGASSSTKGGDKSENNHTTGETPDQDYWVVKISSDGTKQWDKTLGSTQEDYLTSLIALPENQGYLLVGNSYSNAGGDKSDNSKGDSDYWVVKIGPDGRKSWDKTIGGGSSDYPAAILPTTDGNYLLAGYSASNAGGDKSDNSKGQYDFWIVKIKPDGTKLWDRTIGSPDSDYLSSAAVTADCFLLSGSSYGGSGHDKSEAGLGRSDFWVVKINSDGQKIWDRTLGANKDEVGTDAVALADGGYLIGGFTDSNTSAFKSENNRGDIDYWVIKLAADGNYVWDKNIGSSRNDILNGLAQTASGDLLLLGDSYAEASGDKTQNPIGPDGDSDFWLVVLKETECITPTLSSKANPAQSVLQNTPGVTLIIEGCVSGQIKWTGPAGTSGTGPTIPVNTAAIGSMNYSATCTRGSCSATLSSTVEVAAPSAKGAFDGYVYGADCGTFRGWAWDGTKPNTPVTVEILDGPHVLATLSANAFRPDLQTAGKGNGQHAFSFAIPDEIRDSEPHILSARIRNSSFILKGSPKALVCSFEQDPENKPPVAPTPTVLIAPVAAQVGVPFSGTLVAFTDPEGGELAHWIDPLPDGLQFYPDTRVLSGTPVAAGTFLVTYSAYDNIGNSNSVSFQITVSPASTTNVTGSFEGYLDKLDCGGIRGWVWDRNKPNTPLTVEFYLDGSGTVLGSAIANIYRPDLKDANKGNGAHAYNFTPPGSVTNGTLIKARVLGSTFELKGGAKAYQCAPARLSAETGSGLQATVLGNPVSDRIEVEIRGAEGLPLRLQLTDVNGRLINQRQIEMAKPLEQATFSISQQAAGLLLLRVMSNQQSVLLKIVKQ
ncbi:hypothetical protein GCM10028804_05400 [Larkinella terrae]